MSAATAVVMAKAPRPGHAKTRLEPLLGPHGCARLQEALLRNVCGVALDAGLRLTVAVDPPSAVEQVAELVPHDARVVVQAPGGLGARMQHASQLAFADGAAAVVLLGVDAPTLQPVLLRSAVRQLREADVVLGPARDGGYYLLASRRPVDAVFGLEPALWGGPRVLARTLGLAREAGLAVALLPVLRDLDTPADAAVLLADPLLPTEIAEALATTAERV